ncbi:MAG: (2Fe-2S)-binding protein [Bacillota bacterium]|jgi:bacterioferritin-associated ferredoxin|nr:(2Fe-2S)-binding protein [Bacillota bacterium]HOB42080.1 (2Fe-2S)-binding protein [Bacillota bacterium]HOK71588.1 (2Fe-2S)-binding protein [Bacillota bacterium]HOO30526.1 (2Fe-2S)-binding protein [Bacillota bacterium]HPQ03490.1 (2Fe-2S)-binding protein [Bacillota bacterium]
MTDRPERIDDDVIVCRCEDVTLGDIRRLIANGYHTIDEIKRISRAGMGQCQGRTCRHLIARELATALGVSVEEVEMPTFRPPTRPVLLSTIARGEGDE